MSFNDLPDPPKFQLAMRRVRYEPDFDPLGLTRASRSIPIPIQTRPRERRSHPVERKSRGAFQSFELTAISLRLFAPRSNSPSGKPSKKSASLRDADREIGGTRRRRTPNAERRGESPDGGPGRSGVSVERRTRAFHVAEEARALADPQGLVGECGGHPRQGDSQCFPVPVAHKLPQGVIASEVSFSLPSGESKSF